jgi:hypothetical protein
MVTQEAVGSASRPAGAAVAPLQNGTAAGTAPPDASSRRAEPAPAPPAPRRGARNSNALAKSQAAAAAPLPSGSAAAQQQAAAAAGGPAAAAEAPAAKPAGGQQRELRCHLPDCGVDLTHASDYLKRYRICELHQKVCMSA